jgi:hypothetical protein
VKKALSWPACQIVINAGEDGSLVVGKILDKETYDCGFDAQTGEFGNLISKGIIDPTKVVRAALQDAASVAGLLVTTEAMIAELPKKKALSVEAGCRAGASSHAREVRPAPGVKVAPLANRAEDLQVSTQTGLSRSLRPIAPAAARYFCALASHSPSLKSATPFVFSSPHRSCASRVCNGTCSAEAVLGRP